MNQPFEHLAFRKLGENVVKVNTAAHFRWIPFLPCAVTAPLQCRELRNLFWTSTTSLNVREYIQNCYHICLIYQRACVMETNKLLLTWRMQGNKKWDLLLFIAPAKGVIILQIAISGWLIKHNWSNCVAGRKLNNIKHIKY